VGFVRLGIIKENFLIKLSQLKVPNLYYLFSIPGHLSEKEAITLYRYSKLSNVKVVLEIGSYVGKSTNFLAKGLYSKNGTLHCIDTFANHDMSEGPRNTYREFLQNTEKFRSLLEVHTGFSNSQLIIKKIPNELDLIFIDGSHDSNSVTQDIFNFFPKLRKGSYIIFHDYGNTDGVKKPVDLQIMDKKLLLIDQVDSMLICQKI
jgi:predicted O-methyltransferase YrrM